MQTTGYQLQLTSGALPPRRHVVAVQCALHSSVPFHQVKILITRNFVNTSLRRVSYINPLSVHGNECSNMFVIIIYWFGVQLKIDLPM